MQAVEIPTYDFVTSARCPDATRVETADVILFDGILAFYESGVRELLDLKIFVDADADLRLARRLRRDIVQRGRQVLQARFSLLFNMEPAADVAAPFSCDHLALLLRRAVYTNCCTHVDVEIWAQVLDQYERTVKPSFDSYIQPTKRYADIIIPRGAENTVAIDLLWQNIRYRLNQPGQHGGSALHRQKSALRDEGEEDTADALLQQPRA